MSDESFDCAVCGMRCQPRDFHPHLYCVMRRGGILDPRAYFVNAPHLIAEGYTLTPSVPPTTETTP